MIQPIWNGRSTSCSFTVPALYVFLAEKLAAIAISKEIAPCCVSGTVFNTKLVLEEHGLCYLTCESHVLPNCRAAFLFSYHLLGIGKAFLWSLKENDQLQTTPNPPTFHPAEYLVKASHGFHHQTSDVFLLGEIHAYQTLLRRMAQAQTFLGGGKLTGKLARS